MAVAAAGPLDDALKMKKALQSAVQSVQWTYIIFWQFCPQQQVLVWGDGYYNGAIKTRKTVQPVEVSTEEAALSRSEQLRELYDSLASGDLHVTENQQPTIRRPSVALSPEDLTESEWFYLMCVSFSFPPGVGLVGQAYAKQQQQHLWLTGANEVDCKAFTRAILAKSARIQTVVCIPLLNGVVELGTTEKVEEAVEFVQHIKLFFTVDNDNPISTLPPPKPALSAHSSNTTLSRHQMPTTTMKPPNTANSMDDDDVENELEEEDEEEEENEDNDDEEEEENRSDFEEETCQEVPHQNESVMDPVVEANDQLLQSNIYDDIRFGSPNDGSSNLDGFRLLAMNPDESCRAELTQRWSDNLELPNIHLHASEAFQPEEEPATEDSHYTRTVSTVLHNQLTQWSNSHSATLGHSSAYSTQSSFTTWTSNHHHHSHHHHLPSSTNSQRLLKYMLFTVPFLHSNIKSSVTSRLRKTTSHEELSANHVLAERRRREKLNERFIILRSLVPLVTKMDKASILGDTIEYVKQLRKKIQDLEARDRHALLEKRKMRVVDQRGKTAVQVEVSIIESDALVELQCRNREGLLVDLMKKLRELGVEIMTIQSCVDGGMVVAEIRAKVKVKANNGKKISIMQVKKAINQIISSPLY